MRRIVGTDGTVGCGCVGCVGCSVPVLPRPPAQAVRFASHILQGTVQSCHERITAHIFNQGSPLTDKDKVSPYAHPDSWRYHRALPTFLPEWSRCARFQRVHFKTPYVIPEETVVHRHRFVSFVKERRGRRRFNFTDGQRRLFCGDARGKYRGLHHQRLFITDGMAGRVLHPLPMSLPALQYALLTCQRPLCDSIGPRGRPPRRCI